MALNSKGFSLIEVLIVSGILVISALATSTIVSNMNRQIVRIEAGAHSDALLRNVTIAFSTPGVCQFNLKSPNFSALTFNPTDANAKIPIRILEMQSGGGTVPLINTTGTVTQPTAGYWVKSLELQNLKQVGTGNIFLGELVLAASKDAPTTSSSDETKDGYLEKTIPLYLNTTGAPGTVTIVDCSAINNFGGANENQIITGWPNNLKCGGTVWSVYRKGQYHCFRGGETTTRSSFMEYDPVTKEFSGCDNGGTCPCPEPTDPCRAKTVDELMTDGLGK